MTNQEDKSEFEKLKFAREQLEQERAHRREKLWKIFSWAGTILVAITGGTVALKTDPPDKFNSSWLLWATVIAAVLILAAYSVLWIKQNLNILRKVDKAIDNCDYQLGIENVLPKKEPLFGYIWALIMLAAAAIVASLIHIQNNSIAG